MRSANPIARPENNRQQQFEDVKRRIHSKLVDKLDLSRVGDLKGDTLVLLIDNDLIAKSVSESLTR